MKTHALLLTLCLAPIALMALPSRAHAADVIDHGAFDTLLSKYVDGQGRVAYAKLHASKEDRATLDQYVDQIGAASLEGASSKAAKAYYINAYNALVIDAVVDRWPVQSVMKVDGFFKEIKHKVAGRAMTLDALENTVIRPTYKDARVHFVLVCAAKSCPRLQKKALTEKNVDKVMGAATKEFVNKATSVEGAKVTTSQLFNWFKDDFVRDEGSVRAYLAKYSTKALPKEGEITFSEYDWAINKR